MTRRPMPRVPTVRTDSATERRGLRGPLIPRDQQDSCTGSKYRLCSQLPDSSRGMLFAAFAAPNQLAQGM